MGIKGWNYKKYTKNVFQFEENLTLCGSTWNWSNFKYDQRQLHELKMGCFSFQHNPGQSTAHFLLCHHAYGSAWLKTYLYSNSATALFSISPLTEELMFLLQGVQLKCMFRVFYFESTMYKWWGIISVMPLYNMYCM